MWLLRNGTSESYSKSKLQSATVDFPLPLLAQSYWKNAMFCMLGPLSTAKVECYGGIKKPSLSLSIQVVIHCSSPDDRLFCGLKPNVASLMVIRCFPPPSLLFCFSQSPQLHMLGQASHDTSQRRWCECWFTRSSAHWKTAHWCFFSFLDSNTPALQIEGQATWLKILPRSWCVSGTAFIPYWWETTQHRFRVLLWSQNDPLPRFSSQSGSFMGVLVFIFINSEYGGVQ